VRRSGPESGGAFYFGGALAIERTINFAPPLRRGARRVLFWSPGGGWGL